MVTVLGRIFLCTQKGTAGGVLQSIPVAGGKVRADLDITTVGGSRFANAVGLVGLTVYLATFDSGVTASNSGGLFSFNAATLKKKKVMQLPQGKRVVGTNTWNTGVVNMQRDPNNAKQIVLAGLFGDLLTIDPDQANNGAKPKVVSHFYTGGINSAGNFLSNLTNSFFADPTGNDWVVGSRDGHVERWVNSNGGSAEKIISGVGANGSVNGIWYNPVPKNFDKSFGAGCRAKGANSHAPTDVSFGAATPGNRNFALGLFGGNPGDSVLLAIGLNKLSPSFRFAGTLCDLHVNPLIVLPGGKLTGTIAGTGKVRIPVPLPPAPKGVVIFRQWAMLNAASPGGIAVSNAREINIQ